MEFNEYQKEALQFASYPQRGNNLIYPALGLCGEAGEAVDKIKKIWRDQEISNGDGYSKEQKIELAKELSDVLWYLAALASELDFPLDYIAALNIAKLKDRHLRGVIKSEGDSR
jgi:NTP pyrophosphatase (non-canonical NTP hydrolase)